MNSSEAIAKVQALRRLAESENALGNAQAAAAVAAAADRIIQQYSLAEAQVWIAQTGETTMSEYHLDAKVDRLLHGAFVCACFLASYAFVSQHAAKPLPQLRTEHHHIRNLTVDYDSRDITLIGKVPPGTVRKERFMTRIQYDIPGACGRYSLYAV